MQSELKAAMVLALSVVERCLAGAIIPMRQQIPVPADALHGDCHDNVARYVLAHPTCKQERGFLIAPRLMPFGYLVIPHSVVEAPDGSLHDITPNDLGVPLPFVRHVGTLEQFDLIARVEPYTLEVPDRLLDAV